MTTNNVNNKKNNLLSKIKDIIVKVFDYLNTLVTKFGTKINSPRICAISWKIAIKRHNFKKKKNKRNILVLYRSLGIEDFSYFKLIDKKNISMFVFPRSQIKTIFKSFFGNREHHPLRDNNYLTNDKIIEAKKIIYRNFLINTLKILNKEYKFSSIVGFNFSYHAEREFHHAATKNKINFICLHKESIIYPGELHDYTKMLNKLGKYGGKYILVYNEYIRKAILSTKLIESHNIKSIGMPRADYYYNLKNKKVKRIGKEYFLIILMNPKRGVFFIKNPEYLKKKLKLNIKDITWDKLSKSMIFNILEFAKKNQNIEFIFKIKQALKNENDLKNIGLQDLLYDNKLKNCKLIHDQNTGTLIKDAKAIIGFNSTVLIECLIINKPIIIPIFGIRKKSVFKNFILNMKNTAFYAKNENQFQSILKKITNSDLNSFKYNKKITKKITHFYIGNSDGLSTDRLSKYINN